MEKRENSLLSSYVTGFILSLILTIATYCIAFLHLLSSQILVGAIAALAILQTAVQLLLFLHLGREKKPHWKVAVFLFMATVLVVIVLGSLWIMYSLDYNVMPHNMEMNVDQSTHF